MDVAAGEDRLFAGLKTLVLHELDTMTVVDERVARDARFLLVGFAETSVDHEPSAVGADGCLALDRTYRHVAVDNPSGRGVKPELL